MPATIIDGNAVAEEIKHQVAAEAAQLASSGPAPRLAVVFFFDKASS